MFTRIFMMAAILQLLSCSNSELQASESAEIIIYPERRVVVDELNSKYAWGVALPTNSSGDLRIPQSFDGAVSIVSDHLDGLIMARLSDALAQACRSYGSCRLESPEFWDFFDEQIGHTLIDADDSLGEYAPRLSEKLAESWCLFDGCLGDKALANAFPSCVSPTLAAELIVRGAVARRSGLNASFVDLVAGLGDSGRC